MEALVLEQLLQNAEADREAPTAADPMAADAATDREAAIAAPTVADAPTHQLRSNLARAAPSVRAARKAGPARGAVLLSREAQRDSAAAGAAPAAALDAGVTRDKNDMSEDDAENDSLASDLGGSSEGGFNSDSDGGKSLDCQLAAAGFGTLFDISVPVDSADASVAASSSESDDDGTPSDADADAGLDGGQAIPGTTDASAGCREGGDGAREAVEGVEGAPALRGGAAVRIGRGGRSGEGRGSVSRGRGANEGRGPVSGARKANAASGGRGRGGVAAASGAGKGAGVSGAHGRGGGDGGRGRGSPGRGRRGRAASGRHAVDEPPPAPLWVRPGYQSSTTGR